MPTNPRHLLNTLVEGQASGEITANEFFEALEQIKCGRAKSRSTVAQPGAPVAFDLYILPAAGVTGAAWAGNDGKFAWFYNAAWRFFPFAGGDLLFVDDEQIWIGYQPISAAWVAAASGSGGVLPPPTSPGAFLYATGAAWVPNYMPAQHAVTFLQNSATAVNTAVVGLLQAPIAGATTQGFAVPAGKTLVITAATLQAKTGATVGTYTIDCVVVNAAGAETVLATGTGAANTDVRVYGENLSSGIYLLGGANSIRVGWRNRTGSPGALAAQNHYASVVAFFI